MHSLDFADVQAHVLLSSDRRHIHVHLMRIDDARMMRRRSNGLLDLVTNAAGQLSAVVSTYRASGRCEATIALSHAGLRKLEAPNLVALERPTYANAKSSSGYYGRHYRTSAFAQDCWPRANAILLDDLESIERWHFGGARSERPDLVLILAADDYQECLEVFRATKAALGDCITSFHTEEAAADTEGREHFGFRDGLTKPIPDVVDARTSTFLTQLVPRPPDQVYPSGTLLVGGEPGPSFFPLPDYPDWCHEASFLVVRRLAQDVHGFHTTVNDVASALHRPPRAVAEELMGRTMEGVPLATLNPDGTFDYQDDPAGQACPLHAHIRHVNPRDPTRVRPIYRRSVPFGPRSPSTFERPIKDELSRGLLFMCYQASIEHQFEYVVNKWINAHRPNVSIDALVGRRPHACGARTVAVNAGLRLDLDSFVTAEGGGYFLAPTLKGLAKLLG